MAAFKGRLVVGVGNVLRLYELGESPSLHHYAIITQLIMSWPRLPQGPAAAAWAA